MGLSETILAAIIGALATMATAIVQLIRNRAPSESRPKKNRTRSVLATIALMIGCIVGGYAWSALRAVSAREELEAVMDAKYKEQFAAFVANLAPHNTETTASGVTESGTHVAAHAGQGGAVESLAQLPPCRISSQPEEVGPVTCTERVAQKVSLCAAVPAAAQTRNVRVQARVPKTETGWEEGVLGDAPWEVCISGPPRASRRVRGPALGLPRRRELERGRYPRGARHRRLRHPGNPEQRI